MHLYFRLRSSSSLLALSYSASGTANKQIVSLSNILSPSSALISSAGKVMVLLCFMKAHSRCG